MQNTVQFKLSDYRAHTPTRGTPVSAGFDLYALDYETIVGGEGTVMVRTGVSVKLPPGCYGRIAMRSGLAKNQHLSVSAGVIDIDYRGEICVLVYCTKIGHSYKIASGERFAQLIVENISYLPGELVVEFTDDAAQHTGFGSTGKF